MTNRPLHVAFWALLMALGLSLVIGISDPQAVRVTILAKAEQSRSTRSEETIFVAGSETMKIPTTDTPTPNSRPTESTPTLAIKDADWPIFDDTSHRSEYVDNSADRIPRPYDDIPERYGDSFVVPPFVDTQPVSSSLEPRTTAEHQPFRRKTGATMIVVSPNQLRGRSSRSDEVELLPPPPEMENDTDRLHFGTITVEPAPSWEQTPASAHGLGRQWLEAELFRLRQEVDRLTEAQRISEQLDQLHEQQQQLLAMHQNLPVDRMLEVIDLLRQQLTTARETIPPPQSTKVSAPTVCHRENLISEQNSSVTSSSRCASCHQGRTSVR